MELFRHTPRWMKGATQPSARRIMVPATYKVAFAARADHLIFDPDSLDDEIAPKGPKSEAGWEKEISINFSISPRHGPQGNCACQALECYFDGNFTRCASSLSPKQDIS
jgi:hypothetical protein